MMMGDGGEDVGGVGAGQGEETVVLLVMLPVVGHDLVVASVCCGGGECDDGVVELPIRLTVGRWPVW